MSIRKIREITETNTHYLILYENDALLQRKHTSASEDPLRDYERTIVELCDFTTGKNKETNKQTNKE